MNTKTWSMERKFVRRRRIVFSIGVALIGYVIWQVSGNLWWVEGQGYCWGSMSECFFGEGK